jgi:WhiB family transcriptional regulator, redox-sensing transcriptional regulator
MKQLDSGACRDVDATLFDPMLGDYLAEERAKQYCRRRPVRLHCLAVALGVRGLSGIWGGLTADERARYQAAEHDSSKR